MGGKLAWVRGVSVGTEGGASKADERAAVRQLLHAGPTWAEQGDRTRCLAANSTALGCPLLQAETWLPDNLEQSEAETWPTDARSCSTARRTRLACDLEPDLRQSQRLVWGEVGESRVRTEGDVPYSLPRGKCTARCSCEYESCVYAHARRRACHGLIW